MRSRLLLAIVLASTLVAGCLSGSKDGASSGGDGPGVRLSFRDDWAEHALPYSDHDHHNPAQHQGLSTPNFQELGWDPLLSDYYGRSAGGYPLGASVPTGDGPLPPPDAASQ